MRVRVPAGRIGLSLAILLNVGCAAGVMAPVSESSRDHSGAYDGQWVANHVFTPDTQTLQGWQMRCRKPMDSIAMVVADGVVRPAGSNADIETFVSVAGRFRFDIPLDSKVREAGGSVGSISQGKVTMILRGNLAESQRTGRLTLGVAEFGNGGCTSSYSFQKVSADSQN